MIEQVKKGLGHSISSQWDMETVLWKLPDMLNKKRFNIQVLENVQFYLREQTAAVGREQQKFNALLSSLILVPCTIVKSIIVINID